MKIKLHPISLNKQDLVEMTEDKRNNLPKIFVVGGFLSNTSPKKVK